MIACKTDRQTDRDMKGKEKIDNSDRLGKDFKYEKKFFFLSPYIRVRINIVNVRVEGNV